MQDALGGATWFRARDAAAYIGVSKSYLARLRMVGRGPRYARVGTRVVVYSREDLERFLAERSCRSVAEADRLLVAEELARAASSRAKPGASRS